MISFRYKQQKPKIYVVWAHSQIELAILKG